jgi:hypothetical protein
MGAFDYDKRWIEDYPGLGTGPIPTEPCISEAYYQAERTKVFARTWLKVGRVEDIPEAGDYFVHDIAVCSTSAPSTTCACIAATSWCGTARRAAR